MRGKIFSILLLFLISYALPSFCEEIEIASDVISVDPELEFFIIKAGEDNGVGLGDGVIVHRNTEKIAEAYIIEVRPNVAAAEILNMADNEKIREGDGILIVKEGHSAGGAPKKHRGKWAPILGPHKEGHKNHQTPVWRKTTLTPQGGPRHIPSLTGKEGGDTLTVSIEAPRNQVFAYARLALREGGFSITSSDRAAGILTATKPIMLSITKELWADAVAAIGHNMVVTIEIKDRGSSSELTASSFKEHFQKGRYVKRPIFKDSKYYDELLIVVSNIKERSQH